MMTEEHLNKAIGKFLEGRNSFKFTSGDSDELYALFYCLTGEVGNFFSCGTVEDLKALSTKTTYEKGFEYAQAKIWVNDLSNFVTVHDIFSEDDDTPFDEYHPNTAGKISFDKLDYPATIQNWSKEFGTPVIRFFRYRPFAFFDNMVVIFCANAILGITKNIDELPKITRGIVFGEAEQEIKTMGYVVHNEMGFMTRNMNVNKQDVDISLNYNDDLPHQKILDFINSDKSGVVILHGAPGTGKTSYIRNLIYETDKPYLFMDKSVFGAISESAFIDFLFDHKNSIIVLEDCESLIADRNECSSSVGILLNLSDGILGDSLGLKFICSFNSDLEHIDPAILRKGRLFMKYEFKALTKEKVPGLCKKLGVPEDKFNADTPLCEIYNAMEENGVESKNKMNRIGF